MVFACFQYAIFDWIPHHNAVFMILFLQSVSQGLNAVE